MITLKNHGQDARATQKETLCRQAVVHRPIPLTLCWKMLTGVGLASVLKTDKHSLFGVRLARLPFTIWKRG